MDAFSETYVEARDKFRRACQHAGSEVHAELLSTHRGPLQEDLTIDFARFGSADAKTIVLCVSGTHGAEGYPGSAVQTDWITNRAQSVLESSPELAVWMVHGVNPYGFAWGLRNNENNVDLNRNWIDFSKALPENAHFADLVDVVSPSTVSSNTESEILEGLPPFLKQHGPAQLESTLTQGQFTHPRATSFGGLEPQFSRRVMERFISDHLRSAQRVAYLDFHSGTVGCGDNIFLCFSPPSSPAFARAASWWGENNLDAETVRKKWGGDRPARHGLMYWGLERAFGETVDFSGAVIEFGTLEPEQRMEALWANIYETYLRFGKSVSQVDIQALRARVKAAFDRTGNELWETTVLKNGQWVLECAVKGAKAWQNENG